ncbi:MAG: protein trl (tRNA-associated locus protein) [Candidatus Cloacimonetes bacterium HGW-Cloacimonetes-1]|nr:MAG: protein trl (tRNA-associated locus protein) [Candidatus Cloacimonetes bacterium HGW-Cloacimonetes-1]
MKTKTLIGLALLLILVLSACSYNLPVSATSNPLGTKVGVYSQTGFLGFPPMASKDVAIHKAAQNGGITKISTVNYNMTWMIFIWKYETIVTGE